MESQFPSANQVWTFLQHSPQLFLLLWHTKREEAISCLHQSKSWNPRPGLFFWKRIAGRPGKTFLVGRLIPSMWWDEGFFWISHRVVEKKGWTWKDFASWLGKFFLVGRPVNLVSLLLSPKIEGSLKGKQSCPEPKNLIIVINIVTCFICSKIFTLFFLQSLTAAKASPLTLLSTSTINTHPHITYKNNWRTRPYE